MSPELNLTGNWDVKKEVNISVHPFNLIETYIYIYKLVDYKSSDFLQKNQVIDLL